MGREAGPGCDRLVWVDIETLGIPFEAPIIEVAMCITNLHLEVIDTVDTLVWSVNTHDDYLHKLMTQATQGVSTARWILDTHGKSGLLDKAQSYGQPTGAAEDMLASWLHGHGVSNEPLCGSSVAFDRERLDFQMGSVRAHFSPNRLIDVSALKELCARYNRPCYERMLDTVMPRGKESAHRAASDIMDSIAEFKFYRDEFLLWDDMTMVQDGSGIE